MTRSRKDKKTQKTKSVGLEFALASVSTDCNYIIQLEMKTKQDIYVLSQTVFKVILEFACLVMILIQEGLKLDRLPLRVIFPEVESKLEIITLPARPLPAVL